MPPVQRVPSKELASQTDLEEFRTPVAVKVGVVLCLVCSTVFQTECAQALQVRGPSWSKPWALPWLNHCTLTLLWLCAPPTGPRVEGVPLATLLWDGFFFAGLYWLPTYFWAASVQYLPPSTALTIQMSSLIYVLPLQAWLLHEMPKAMHLASCALCVVGLGCFLQASLQGDESFEGEKEAANGPGSLPLVGVLFSSIYACGYGSYMVILKRLTNKKPLGYVYPLTGAIGLMNLCGWWPALLVFDWTGMEAWEWPPLHELSFVLQILLSIATNSLTFIAVALAGPAFTAVGMTLIIPLATATDWVLHGFEPGALHVGGSLLIGAALVVYHVPGPRDASSSSGSSEELLAD